MFIGLIFTFFLLLNGDWEVSIIVFLISFALAISGASLMALGSMATNSKRQTALIALQTWGNPPID